MVQVSNNSTIQRLSVELFKAQCTDLKAILLVTSSEQSTVSCSLWSNLRCKFELTADWPEWVNAALWLARNDRASIHQMTEATCGAWLYNIASLCSHQSRETHPSLTPCHPALSLATSEPILASDWPPHCEHGMWQPGCPNHSNIYLDSSEFE